MKRLLLTFSLVTLFVLALACFCWGITTYAEKPGDMPVFQNQVVQNVTATAPMKAGSVCSTKVLTHGGTIGVFNLYTSGKWYAKSDWSVTKADGTAVTVKRTVGDNTAYMPGSSGSVTVNREYATYKLATFSNTSTAAANATYIGCIDRQ